MAIITYYYYYLSNAQPLQHRQLRASCHILTPAFPENKIGKDTGNREGEHWPQNYVYVLDEGPNPPQRKGHI